MKKKINFINRIKYAGEKLLCNCFEVYKINEGRGNIRVFDFLPMLTIEKVETKNDLVEKYKIRDAVFEQKYSFRTT